MLPPPGTGARIVGPNTAGLVTPGDASSASCRRSCRTSLKPGRSRRDLAQRQPRHAGLPQSDARRHRTSDFIGIGGDPMLGTTTRDALRSPRPGCRHQGRRHRRRDRRRAWRKRRRSMRTAWRKPMVAFIAGAPLRPGKKMGAPPPSSPAMPAAMHRNARRWKKPGFLSSIRRAQIASAISAKLGVKTAGVS